jgi:NTE family protein
MRQLAPISPAIHLGAERILVIGAGQIGRPAVLTDVDRPAYPSLAQVAGHAMASIFLDSLSSDIERLDRINRIAGELTPHQRRALDVRPIESLVIAPSERLDAVAARYIGSLPPPVRALLEVLGVGRASGERGNGAGLASYLLFESTYTRVLIDMGFADTMARRDEVLQFLTDRRPAPPPSNVPKVVVV